MIGKLKGLIDSYGEDYVILDVGGVGYQVHYLANELTKRGHEVTVFGKRDTHGESDFLELTAGVVIQVVIVDVVGDKDVRAAV